MASAASMPAALAERKFAFSDKDFTRVRRMIYERAGIALAPHKREMVYGRLARRLRARGFKDFASYLNALDSQPGSGEWEYFTNALTTNLTAFFREPHHFPILAAFVRQCSEPVSIWCCGASTGEEAYSIAITLVEALGPHAKTAKVFATDIDTHAISRARAAVYSYDRVAKLEPHRLKRFFLRGRGAHAGQVKVKPEIANMVTFDTLNLFAPTWPIREKFDAIFCRNVMIYFDKPTRVQVLARFAPLMKPGGLLFAGHSENLTHLSRKFRLRGQTVYECVGG